MDEMSTAPREAQCLGYLIASGEETKGGRISE